MIIIPLFLRVDSYIIQIIIINIKKKVNSSDDSYIECGSIITMNSQRGKYDSI